MKFLMPIPDDARRELSELRVAMRSEAAYVKRIWSLRKPVVSALSKSLPPPQKRLGKGQRAPFQRAEWAENNVRPIKKVKGQ